MSRPKQPSSSGHLLRSVDVPNAESDSEQSLRVPNLLRVMANAETLYPAYLSYMDLLFKPLHLAPELERLIILHVAKESDCFYVWRQNIVAARDAGLSQAQLDALELGEIQAVCFNEAEKAAFAFADEVIRFVEVTSTTFSTTQSFFSDRVITEMLFVIGTYMFLSRLARTGRVPLDKTA